MSHLFKSRGLGTQGEWERREKTRRNFSLIGEAAYIASSFSSLNDTCHSLNRGKIESNLTVYLESKGAMRTPTLRSSNWAPSWHVSRLASISLQCQPRDEVWTGAIWILEPGLQTYQVRAHFEAFIECCLMVPLDFMYTKVGFNPISVQVCCPDLLLK